jgi:hypothetical protein
MSETEVAKIQLREHLGSLLVNPIAEGLWSIYASSKDLCDRNNQPDQVLRTFQNMITRIPEWSEETLGTEVNRILKVSKCNYMDDLLMGVFISYMKSFASLHYRGHSAQIRVEFERPNVSKFIHELYKHSARRVWQTAYLFRTIGVTSEQQARNRQEIEKIISECIEQVIRTFLPWEAIAKNYFVDGSSDSQPQSAPPAASKSVVFEDVFDDESESEDEESEDEDEEKPPQLTLSDELATLEVNDLDEKKEDDPLKEIESKIGETLVLNL